MSGCGCNGGSGMKKYGADDDTEEVATNSNTICDSSPQTYARNQRMNKSLMAGVLFTVLGGAVAPALSQGDDSWKNRGLVGFGIGSLAVIGNYMVMGGSIMDAAQTEYDELCPAYTGGGHTGEEEVDNADVQP